MSGRKQSSVEETGSLEQKIGVSWSYMSGIEIEIFGIVAACLVNGATLPQIIKTATTKQVRDISLPFWIILFTGAFFLDRLRNFDSWDCPYFI